jgi:3,4-dihydroxy 2-butanone 4-phosphate synthase
MPLLDYFAAGLTKMQPPRNQSLEFDSIPETIEAFRRGEFIIVLDSQDRENEGDLIISAQHITTEKMAFLVRYSSGYICAPISAELSQSLALPQMVPTNQDPKRTAYTISIDAADETVTTGISAHDRATTCRLLASPKTSAKSFIRPGHIIPLKARDGGVLERPGHTEATLDFCRLAGKPLAGVIGELVEDGEHVPGVAEFREPGMMRRDACLEFGKKWNLKVCTIEALVEYLRAEKANLPIVNGVNGVH